MYRTSGNALALTAGGSPILAARTTEVANLRPVEFAGTRGEPVAGHANPWIYRTTNDGSASYPFNQFGNLVIQSRSDASQHIVFVTGSTPAPVLSVTADGRVRAHVAGSAAYPIFSWYDDTDTGIYRPAPDSVGISVGGAARLVVSTTDVRIDRPVVLAPFTGAIRSASNAHLNTISGGTNESSGANVILYGPDHSGQPGVGWLRGNTAIAARWQGSTFTVPTTLVIPVK